MILKTNFLSTLFILNLLVACNFSDRPGTQNQSLAVMTYNIRFDDPDDKIYGWAQRKEQVTHLIQFYEPVFLGTQEGLLHQLEYLEQNLGHYKWIGVGRDEGTMSGEFSALFYDSTKVSLLEGSENTIWLSKTPSKPSMSWDAALPRILTYGEFRDQQTGQQFFVFNTHFDHLGETARTESAKIIIQEISRVAENKPVILTGDFNTIPGSEPYSILTSSKTHLFDAHKHSTIPHVGPSFTFEGFEIGNNDKRRRIDYIFVNDKISVKNMPLYPPSEEKAIPPIICR